jgi:beta-galactosidase/beta-glucuronidase
MKPLVILAAAVVCLALGAAPSRGADADTGRPGRNSAPATEVPQQVRRNLALHRPVFQSSAYDYNLTAQLVTDGIVDQSPPRWIGVSTADEGALPKHRRERILDGNWVTEVELEGSAQLPGDADLPWLVVEIGGAAPQIDRVDVLGVVKAAGSGPENWSCIVSGSDDGKSWTKLGMSSGMTRAVGELDTRIRFTSAARFHLYRLQFVDARARTWKIQEVEFGLGDEKAPVGGPHVFSSAWKSLGAGDEWLYADLGEGSRFDRVVLHWLNGPRQGAIEVSSDATSWREVVALSEGHATDLSFPAAQARYLRVRMDRPSSPAGYVLSELEVWGARADAATPRAEPGADPRGALELSRGSWRVQRDSLVSAGGAALSRPGYDDSGWVAGTVPGTVLTSYVNAGIIPDPNFGDNQLLISDSFFHADFWYRTRFIAPRVAPDRLQWLCFDGINWKAEIFLNSEPVGRIDGAFSRRRFDVTSLLHPGAPNALAVRIERNAHPGSVKEKTFEHPGVNGGVLGADNPTFHAAIGWDWIPTIRGRNTGIWDRVFLTVSGPVTLDAPEVATTLSLPDTSRADVRIGVNVRNHRAAPLQGSVRLRLGEVKAESRVSLAAGEAREVWFAPASHPQLQIEQPRLWWPNGYGDPDLYDVRISVCPDREEESDVLQFRAGLRQVTATPPGQPFKLWINGRRFVAKGGNWGFSESMLRYRAREFDAAVRYHRDMNFTMIRNWVGMTGHDALFDACDRHGILIWQDFWLANPWDGVDPDDPQMFLANARELVRRIRVHPSVAMYCGRNEGYPPKVIEDGLREILAGEHAGVPFLPSSADGDVGGHGPYQAKPVDSYAGAYARTKWHSEMGMPNIPTLESVRLMMPEKDLWPMGRLWGMHDFCLNGAQGGQSFLDMLKGTFGAASSLEEWVTQAQFLNYDGYRAMFEADNENRMGLLIWMSHPAWPSFVWQTYDYYLAPTAAYFGAKKACEPLHIQWNPATDRIEVVNISAGSQAKLFATATLFDLTGRHVWTKTAPLASEEDSTTPLFAVQRPPELPSAYVLRLVLTRGAETVSTNDYLRGGDDGTLLSLRQLPQVRLRCTASASRHADAWIVQVRLSNPTTTAAVMASLMTQGETSGTRILPALFSDNYVTLLPGEQRDIVVELPVGDTRGEKPCVSVAGYNVEKDLVCMGRRQAR